MGKKSKYKPGIVIIGAGHAGVQAAEQIRKMDSKIRLYVLDPDKSAFYFRAALKFFLKQKITEEKLNGRQKNFWKINNITRLELKVVRIERNERKIYCEGDVEIEYTKLLIATGGTPFIPNFAGGNFQNIVPIRSLTDAQNITQIISGSSEIRCVILGGGVLGMELADALISRGKNTVLITNKEVLIPKMLDQRAAEIIRQLSEENGLDIRFNTTIKEIKGNEEGKVSALVLSDNSTIPCDALFVCTGITRNTEIARQAGLETNKGIIVNQFLQTSDPVIYAAGDVVEFNAEVNIESHLIELWGPAGKMGQIAALNMMGKPIPFEKFTIHAYTILWNHNIHAIGNFIYTREQKPEGFEVLSIEDDVGGTHNYFKLVFQGRQIVGAMSVGQARDPIVLEYIISHRIPVPADISKEELLLRDFDLERIYYHKKD